MASSMTIDANKQPTGEITYTSRIVYYASLLGTESSDYFIGVFSASVLAQAACQGWYNTIGDKRQLLWIGFGDALTANTDKGRFEIDAIELDRAIQPADYAPTAGN